MTTAQQPRPPGRPAPHRPPRPPPHPRPRPQRALPAVEVAAPTVARIRPERDARRSTSPSSWTAPGPWAATTSSRSPSRPCSRRSTGSSAEDRFAVVTYDDRGGRRHARHPGHAGGPREATRRLARGRAAQQHGPARGLAHRLRAGGRRPRRRRASTASCSSRTVSPTAASRDPEELARLAYDLRRRGVTTSTFGVGTDFDEALLQAMADNGGGHFYFAGDVAQMRDHITSEVGETLEDGRPRGRPGADPAGVRAGRLAVAVPGGAGRRPRPGLPGRHGLRAGPLDRAPADLRLRGRGARGGRSSSASRTATARSRRPCPPWSRRRSPGRTPTTPPTTPSRATWRWTGSWPGCSRSVPSRRPCGSTARAATTTPAGSSAPCGTRVEQLRRRGRRACNDLVAELSEEQVHYAAPMPEMARKAAYFESSNLLPDAHVGGEVPPGLRSRRSRPRDPAAHGTAGSFHARPPDRPRAPEKSGATLDGTPAVRQDTLM